MEYGKLTAKLRDAVPVCFIENSKEIKRFKNIDEIKKLPYKDFEFSVPPTGGHHLQDHLRRRRLAGGLAAGEGSQKPHEQGRAKYRRHEGQPEEETPEDTTALSITQSDPLSDILAADQQAEEGEQLTEAAAEEIEAELEAPATMEIAFGITGDRRKALVEAVSSFLGMKPVYMNAPTFGYSIGSYRVSKNGTLIGDQNEPLIPALQAKGFTPRRTRIETKNPMPESSNRAQGFFLRLYSFLLSIFWDTGEVGHSSRCWRASSLRARLLSFSSGMNFAMGGSRPFDSEIEESGSQACSGLSPPSYRPCRAYEKEAAAEPRLQNRWFCPSTSFPTPD